MNNHIFRAPVKSVEAGAVGFELQREALLGNVMGVCVCKTSRVHIQAHSILFKRCT